MLGPARPTPPRLPTDQVNNPGTINALINIAQRPTFANESVIRWRKVQSCTGPGDEDQCWCEPGRNNKCWARSEAKETVHHILKGGEDSIGALEAIQRVYFNIGSCSEQCWVNHLSDLRQLDPQQRGFGQTPFKIGQCRRDCPNFRAIEDRLPNILDFFLSQEAHATDLRAARENELRRTIPMRSTASRTSVDDLDKEFGNGCRGARRKGVCAKLRPLPFEPGRSPCRQADRTSTSARYPPPAVCAKTGWQAIARTGVRGRHRSAAAPCIRITERSRMSSNTGPRPCAPAPADRQSQGSRRRRTQLLPQHFAAQSCGRMLPSCTTTRSARSCAASRRTRPTISTTSGRAMSTPNNKLLPPDQQPACFEVRSRAWMAASDSTRRRWRNCSTPQTRTPKVTCSARHHAARRAEIVGWHGQGVGDRLRAHDPATTSTDAA